MTITTKTFAAAVGTVLGCTIIGSLLGLAVGDAITGAFAGSIGAVIFLIHSGWEG